MESHEEFGVTPESHPPVHVPSSPPRRGPSLGVVVLVAILFGGLAGFGGMLGALWAVANGHVNIAGLLQNAPADNPIASVLPATTTTGGQLTGPQIATAMNETVVNINTLAVQQDPMSFFFGGGGTQQVQGLGTGVIVDANGYILTNYHVVENADNIKVTIMHAKGKNEYKATLVGGDKQEDLAVLKINANGLKAAKFGDSDRLQPGEWVMAIGNPFGFEHTVSAGVVSALNRRLPVEDGVTMKGMIQTDASINPGNSGGPLMNQRGEVIGINSAVFVGRGNGQPQANGIGFAIPSNRAKTVYDTLKAGKSVDHPYLGVKYLPITDEVRQQKHLPVKGGEGVLVSAVMPDSPADKAGVQPEDIILAIDSLNLTGEETGLADYIAKQPAGKSVTLKVKRDNGITWDEKSLKVKLENMPKQQAQEAPQESQPRIGIPLLPN